MNNILVRIYDSPERNGQLGAPAGRRLVVLSGTAKFNQHIGTIDTIRPDIEAALKKQGFDVVAVRVSSSGLIWETLNIEIEINVDYQYSAEDARQSALAVLSNATRSWLFGDYNYLTDVSLQVVQDFQTTVPYDPKNANDRSKDSSIDDILKALAPKNLLGTSGTTVFAVAGVLALIIILKR